MALLRGQFWGPFLRLEGVMRYVVVRGDDGAYLAKLDAKVSYTTDLRAAWIFATASDAQKQVAHRREKIVVLGEEHGDKKEV
jgi:hypothetical protein